MQEVTRDIFYQTTRNWEWVSYTQNDVWCRSLVPEDTLHYFIDERQPAEMGCVGYERRKAGLSMLIIAGECLRGELDHKLIRDFYANVGQLGFDIIEINSNSLYSPQYEIGIREAGLLRPVGLFSTALSKLVDLQKPLIYDKNWRYNLKKCDASSLTFHLYDKENVTDSIISSYIRIHQEMVSHKHFHDDLDAQRLRCLLEDRHFALGTIFKDNELIAGIVVYMENHKYAISLYAATSPQGRELSASYILYRETMLYAANERHIPLFDMGRITPSAHAKNMLFQFKNGIGGTVVQYNGEWQWTRRKWMPMMLYFMKKYIWKRVQV